MNKGELLATGRTAEVYEWGPGQVLKLYHPWWSRQNIEFEATIGRTLYNAGVASPRVGDIVEIEGQIGLVYERIDGPPMDKAAFEDPNRIIEMAQVFAQVHADLHKTTLSDFPSQRSRFLYNISERTRTLDEKSRQHALNVLATLPDGNSLCHGDLHPGNLIMSPDGPRIIDWENVCIGSPLADVARSALLLEAYPFYVLDGPNHETALAAIADFRQAYLNEYVALTGADRTLIDAWRVPVAAARLEEGIEIEEQFLKSICTPASQ